MMRILKERQNTAGLRGRNHVSNEIKVKYKKWKYIEQQKNKINVWYVIIIGRKSFIGLRNYEGGVFW